jgi:hypothetical protein
MFTLGTIVLFMLEFYGTKAQISSQNPQFPSVSFSPFISLTLPPIYPFHPPPLIAISPSLLLLNNNLSPQTPPHHFITSIPFFFNPFHVFFKVTKA